MNEKAMKFKIELGKMNEMLKKLEEEILQLNGKKRELNQKRYDLIKQGGQKAKVLEVNKELQQVAEEIKFYQDQIEVTKEMNADAIHELVVDMIKYRDERMTEMNAVLKEIQEKLEREKFEYLKKVREIYTVPFNEFQAELNEINDLIRRNGDGTRFGYPRILTEKRLTGFPEPIYKMSVSPFIKAEDVQTALAPVPTSYSLKLFLETGEIEKDENNARLKLEQMKKKGV